MNFSSIHQSDDLGQTFNDEDMTLMLGYQEERFSMNNNSKGSLPESCVSYLQNGFQVMPKGDVALPSTLDTDLKVSLADEDLWQKFADEGTEMVVTKPGRRLYPSFRVKMEGLDPNQTYCLIMDFASTSTSRYKYQNHNWIISGRALPILPTTYYIHPESPTVGSKLLNQIVSFQKAKLTSSAASLNYGKLLVHSMHRYQPRLHVARADDITKINPDVISTFSFDLTSFIAVTAYQNIEITKLKVAHNPFAKGFRTNGGKRKKSFDDCSQSATSRNHEECLCAWNRIENFQGSHFYRPNGFSVKVEESTGNSSSWPYSQTSYHSSGLNRLEQDKSNKIASQEIERFLDPITSLSSFPLSSNAVKQDYNIHRISTTRAESYPYSSASPFEDLYEMPSHKLMRHNWAWNCSCSVCSRKRLGQSSDQQFASRNFGLDQMQSFEEIHIPDENQYPVRICNGSKTGRNPNTFSPNSHSNPCKTIHSDSFNNGTSSQSFFYPPPN